MLINSIRTIRLFFAFVLVPIASFAQASPHDLYVGTWKGEMNIGRRVPVEFVFERAGNVLKGIAVDPSGAKTALPQVMGFESGMVFKLDRGDDSFMVFTGKLGADKISLSGEVTIMEGKVERGKAPWSAKKVVATASAPAATPGGPTPVQAADERGRMLFSKKDYAGAITSFSECLRFEPTNTSCLAGRAHSFNRAGKYREAIADFDGLIKELPKPPAQAYLDRASARIRIEDYDEAIADADRAFAVNRTADAHLTRGEAFQQKGGLIHFAALYRGQDARSKGIETAAKGLVEFNTFIQLKPRDHRGYWLRGVYYYQLWNLFNDDSRLKDGLTDLDKAVSLAPQVGGVYYSRYEIHGALGNKTAAAADLAKYNELSKK